MAEQWRDIPGFEGRYQVSDLGNVKSLNRLVEHKASDGKRGYVQAKTGKVLRPGRTSSGHLTVVLGKENGSKYVHSLVLLSFVGPAPKGMEVCHNNSDPSDNRLRNLRYDTRSSNNVDSSRIGNRGKLTEDQVRYAREKYCSKEKTATQLSKELGVALASICKAITGDTYAWVQ